MNTTDEKITQQEIIEGLEDFHGTSQYYRYSPSSFPLFYLTVGTYYVAEKCNAYWLFDFIASNQVNPKISDHPKLQELQCWELKVKDSSGVITCSWDKGDEIVLREKIDHTDFPLENIKIWVSPLIFLGMNGIEKLPKRWAAYLPSEHRSIACIY